MDKLTKLMRGRARLALLLMVCMVAIVALPAFAHAAAFSSEFPAPNASLHTTPTLIAVDVMSGNVKSASITVNGTAYVATAVGSGASTGSWVYSETGPVNGVYTPHWTWTAGVVSARTTLLVNAPVIVVGSNSVSVVATDKANASLGTDSWSFTVAANGTGGGGGGSVAPQGVSNANCLMSGCHAGQGWETDNSMGPNCISCHYDGFPAHGLNGHVAHAAIDKTKSSACVACHGSDYLNVATKTGTTYTVPAGAYPPAAGSSQEHAGCSCHSYNEAGPGKSCVDCHAAQYAPHGFNNTTATASGHNTTAYNGFGAKTKFDGSQGTTITWTVTAAGTASVTPAAGASGSWLATSGPTASGVTTTTWAFPTQSVFWNTQSNGLGGTATDDIAPAGAISGLSSSSIITCQDCHTGLNAAGPHGAAQNWGIDPNYPGDYGYAELTKYVTCNTQYTSATLPGQSLDTTPAHFAIFLTKADAIAKTNGYAATDPAAASSPYFTPLSISGIDVRSTLATAGLLINRTDGTTGASAVICAKCHDLENFNYASWAVEGANTAHDSHHQDQTNGSSQCVSCHVGLPHGWTRPRLLVNTATDVAPYLSPDELGTSASATTSTLGGGSAGMLSLSAINNHPLGGSVQEPYSTGNGASSTTTYTAFDGNGNVVSPAAGVTYNPGHVGYAYWNEGQCAACNDHNSSSNLDKSTGPRIR